MGAAIQLSPTGIFNAGWSCAGSADGSKMGASARRNSSNAIRCSEATSAGLASRSRAAPAHTTIGVMTKPERVA